MRDQVDHIPSNKLWLLPFIGRFFPTLTPGFTHLLLIAFLFSLLLGNDNWLQIDVLSDTVLG